METTITLSEIRINTIIDYFKRSFTIRTDYGWFPVDPRHGTGDAAHADIEFNIGNNNYCGSVIAYDNGSAFIAELLLIAEDQEFYKITNLPHIISKWEKDPQDNFIIKWKGE